MSVPVLCCAPQPLWSHTEVTQEDVHPQGGSQLSSTLANTRSAVSTEVKEFAIVPLHSAPSDAVAEINSLYDVYLDVRQKWDLNVSRPPHPCLGLWGPP